MGSCWLVAYNFGVVCDFDRLGECDEEKYWAVVWMWVLLVEILRGSVSVTKVSVGCDSDRLCECEVLVVLLIGR